MYSRRIWNRLLKHRIRQRLEQHRPPGVLFVARSRFALFEAEAVSLPWVLAQRAERAALEAEGRWSNAMICECGSDADLPF